MVLFYSKFTFLPSISCLFDRITQIHTLKLSITIILRLDRLKKKKKKNGQHFAKPPLVSLPNDIWETSAEIPYRRRVTTQSWVVLKIGRAAWENLIQPIRSTTQIWVVMRHQYGISALVSQKSFGGETSSGVAKCRLFSQARTWVVLWWRVVRMEFCAPFSDAIWREKQRWRGL